MGLRPTSRSACEFRAGAVVTALLALLLCGGLCDIALGGPAEHWEYQFLSERTRRAFDLRFRVQAASGGVVRVLVTAPDTEDGFFIELSQEGIASGRIRSGDEERRSVASGVSLEELGGALLVMERRPHRWSLSADGRLVAAGDDPPEPEGRIGFAVQGGDARVYALRFQTVPEVFFTDSFMRTAEDPTSWSEVNGVWRLRSLRNPLLSANAFNYVAAGKPDATAVAGEWFWSDLDFRAACRPAAEGGVGIYVCYRGPEDYFLFRWNSRDSARPVQQFIRKKGKTERVLAEAEGGYAPNQWYTLRALLGSGWVQLGIDDATVFTVRDPDLSYGQIGLFAHGEKETLFDDVRVASRPATLVDFSEYRLGRWLASGGDWVQVAPAAWNPVEWSGGVVVNTPAEARLVWGRPSWENYAIRARVGPWGKGTLGLCFRYQDARNFYSVRWKKASAPVIELWRTENGHAELLGAAAGPADDRPHELGVASEGGRITVSADGHPLLSTSDDAFVRGRVGFYARQVESGRFSEVMYRFLPAARPLAKHRRVFSAEGSMAIWSGTQSDWVQRTRPREGKDPLKIWWHRSDFHGAVRMDLRMAGPPEPDGEVGLVLGRSGGDVSEDYGLRLRGGGDGPTLELISAGSVTAAKVLTWPAGPRTLGIRRDGNVVSACVGGRAVLSCRVSGEQSGGKLGWYAVGVPVRMADVDIYSENVITYDFKTAPTDWRVGSGTWEVASKWQCDPRWSFFSGRSRGAAVLWNKRPLHGDFTIEFYVGNKMDRARGNQYEYAKNMNITVCADGKDLTSGYSILFGGFDNTITCAYRKGERWAVPAASNMRLINQKGLHRKWYHITVSRKGDRLEMRIAEQSGAADEKVIVSKVDDAPLDGMRWALWTYDNGIMIGRVCVSAEYIGRCEPPDVARPATTQSIYPN